LNIINLVRDMRSAEEKEIRLETVNLAEALQISTDILGQRFAAKQLQLIVNIPTDLQIKVEKTSFINSVLNNLFTNAIKFSNPGSAIEVQAEKSAPWIRLSIQDHGIGIPPELLTRIFDINLSTSRSGTSGEKGNGFGMPMVKKFINAYNGGIEIVSSEKTAENPRHGTRITLFLPPADSTPAAD